MNALLLLLYFLMIASLTVLPAFGVGRFALGTGRTFWPWFIGGIFLWPLLALILLLVPAKRQSEYRLAPPSDLPPPSSSGQEPR